MRRAFFEGSGGRIAALCWDRAGASAPLLHFAHATGLNAETYIELLERLSSTFRIVASDFRGHGSTTLPASPESLRGWEMFETDMGILLEQIGSPAILVGHSLGATISLMLAAGRPELAQSLVLLEPAIIPFTLCPQIDAARRAGKDPDFAMAQAAGKRRATWPSREQIRAAYIGRGMFASWPDTWLDAYLASGLRSLAGGAVTLACETEWERATFRTVTTSFWQRLPFFKGHLTLMRGTGLNVVQEEDATMIRTLAPQTEDLVLKGKSHFLPMEAPEIVAATIAAVAQRSLSQPGEPTVR